MPLTQGLDLSNTLKTNLLFKTELVDSLRGAIKRQGTLTHHVISLGARGGRHQEENKIDADCQVVQTTENLISYFQQVFFFF